MVGDGIVMPLWGINSDQGVKKLGGHGVTRLGALSETFPESIASGLSAIGGAGLVEDAGNVVGDSSQADDKSFGDFPVVLACGQKT